jgi:2-polyprenyl-3-methyl-5-hydroxy-6-metoxy-1,4-benzoquinol methylase
MISWRPCNTCEGTSARSLWERDGYHIVSCNDCGLVYVGEDPDTIDFGALYDEAYYTGGQVGVFDDYVGQAAARRSAARRRLFTLRRLIPSGRLLDVGCAAGFFLAEAQATYEARGVEFSEYSSRFAREKLGLNVFRGTLQDARFEAATFDIVTLWDVIEHVPDPAALLAEVRRVLAPQGRVVLTTGDIGSAYARARGAQWHLLTPPWHLYFFSRATLEAVARRSGLRVVHFAARGVAGDGKLARSRVGILASHLLGRGDITPWTAFGAAA